MIEDDDGIFFERCINFEWWRRLWGM